jgi:ribosomal protein S6
MKIYEVGYLLLPTIPEEHMAAEVQNIKAVIEKMREHSLPKIFQNFELLPTP